MEGKVKILQKNPAFLEPKINILKLIIMASLKFQIVELLMKDFSNTVVHV